MGDVGRYILETFIKLLKNINIISYSHVSYNPTCMELKQAGCWIID